MSRVRIVNHSLLRVYGTRYGNFGRLRDENLGENSSVAFVPVTISTLARSWLDRCSGTSACTASWADIISLDLKDTESGQNGTRLCLVRCYKITCKLPSAHASPTFLCEGFGRATGSMTLTRTSSSKQPRIALCNSRALTRRTIVPCDVSRRLSRPRSLRCL